MWRPLASSLLQVHQAHPELGTQQPTAAVCCLAHAWQACAWRAEVMEIGAASVWHASTAVQGAAAIPDAAEGVHSLVHMAPGPRWPQGKSASTSRGAASFGTLQAYLCPGSAPSGERPCEWPASHLHSRAQRPARPAAAPAPSAGSAHVRGVMAWTCARLLGGLFCKPRLHSDAVLSDGRHQGWETLPDLAGLQGRFQPSSSRSPAAVSRP